MSSDLNYVVEALKLLTERPITTAFVQSSLIATQEYLKLHLMKLMSVVAIIYKHLNVVKPQGASSTAGEAKGPSANKETDSKEEADEDPMEDAENISSDEDDDK
ncbi:hypothetical protein CJ030_MR6G010421 [Morella rubra]|uniref:Uncharacterized protein n=1 Tax=Morella rubra TaxID=262757 RepID=A0A6A1UZS4_9ROSI|nr:hypothetical protein CJ030_MR7G016914 [Morella rubra]KAB1209785.1 hypothetical protein CJ030_MR6G010421 [Morella rubra]